MLVDVAGGVGAEVISIGAEVIVDDVEDDSEAELVCGIDEGAEIVGMPVNASGSVDGDAVVAPVAVAGEIADGHDLDGGGAEFVNVREAINGGEEGAPRGEGADVKLVNDEVAKGDG